MLRSFDPLLDSPDQFWVSRVLGEITLLVAKDLDGVRMLQ